jgi:cytochrome c2
MMSRTIGFALCAVALAVAAVCAGCGGGATASTSTTTAGGATASTPAAAATAGNELERGRVLFQSPARDNLRCGFCHSLQSAETTGQFGVDLDDEFGLDRKNGRSEDSIRKEVLDYISEPPCYEPTNPNRCMPKGLYTGADAAAVATFVARCAGRSAAPGCRPVAGGLRGEAALGEHLYANNGCSSCHWSLENDAVGPSMNGLAGSKVELADGSTVTAGDAYLTASILAPDAQIVKGYPRGYMSARVKPGTITAAQAKAIVAYIHTLK